MAKRILLADDSSTIHRLVGATFQDGFEVFGVETGDAVLGRLEEVEPDIVLADLVMPGKNGYELCREIRSRPSLDHIPVILLVGAFDRIDSVQASAVGAAATMQKPFEPEALFNLVSSVIESARVARSAAHSAARPIAVEDDLLGLSQLFPPVLPQHERPALTPAEIEMIADRVLARLSTEVVEAVAWELVPDIAERVVRDEMRKRRADPEG